MSSLMNKWRRQNNWLKLSKKLVTLLICKASMITKVVATIMVQILLKKSELNNWVCSKNNFGWVECYQVYYWSLCCQKHQFGWWIPGWCSRWQHRFSFGQAGDFIRELGRVWKTGLPTWILWWHWAHLWPISSLFLWLFLAIGCWNIKFQLTLILKLLRSLFSLFYWVNFWRLEPRPKPARPSKNYWNYRSKPLGWNIMVSGTKCRLKKWRWVMCSWSNQVKKYR